LDINTKEATLREAIDYGRFSDKDQGAGDSKRRQTEGAKRFAQTHGLTIVRSVFDDGLSAFHGDHIKYGKLGGLLQEIKDGKIKPGTVLLVECIDRLSREAPIAQFTLLAQILSAGIEVVTFADNQWYTFASINEHPHELFGVLGIMTRANDESKTKAGRHKKNWARKRQLAAEVKLTAMGPSWLRLMPGRKRWKAIQDRVLLVRRIFAMACKGLGRRRIAILLNHKKFQPWGRSKWWTGTYVGRIIRNRAVIGEFQPGIRQGNLQVPIGEPLKGYYPAIVKIDQFQKANAIRKRRAPKSPCRYSDAVNNLFKGRVFDGKTGAAMHYKKILKNPRHSYLFSSAIETGAAPNQWNYMSFEQNALYHLDRIDWVQLSVEAPDNFSLQERRRLEIAIEKVQKGLNKMLSYISVDAEPPNTLLREMKRMEGEKVVLEQQLADLARAGGSVWEQQREMARAKEELENLLRAGNTGARKRLREEIHKIVKRIDIWATPGSCSDLRALQDVIAKTLANAGWEDKANPTLWPSYRITFSNDAVRWVLCKTTRLRRIGSRPSPNPAQDSVILTTWNSQSDV
jgi:DNA invertase Pin-like site-specific DNA recombinase